ncbi:MAG: hypothetical protein RLZZ574_3361 [Cyanobacteriota bacterium]|jgi:anthranilate/para-aminobenzoate synthase component II
MIKAVLEVGRYHSLYALSQKLPAEFKVTAMSDDGVIMGIEHQRLAIAAIQFHPESIMTLSQGTGQAIKEEQEQIQLKITALMRSQIAYSQPEKLAKFRQIMI